MSQGGALCVVIEVRLLLVDEVVRSRMSEVVVEETIASRIIHPFLSNSDNFKAKMREIIT